MLRAPILFLALSLPVLADVVSQQNTVANGTAQLSYTFTNQSAEDQNPNSISFPKFDPSLGTLVDADVTVNRVEFSGSVSYANPAPNPGSFDIEFFPQMMGYTTADHLITFVNVNPGLVDVSDVAWPNSTDTVIWDREVFDAGSYDSSFAGTNGVFVGAGNLTSSLLVGLSFWSEGHDPNLLGPQLGRTTANYDYSVTYTYSPTVAPEPGEWAGIAVIGVAGLGYRMRKQSRLARRT